MFKPQRIIFEQDVLKYDMAKDILEKCKGNEHIEIIHLSSNRLNQYIPGDNLPQKYQEGKNTLIIGTKKSLKFQTCKPSAHYQLPLISGCMGRCQYCYLNTMLGDKPYVKIHVNIDDILAQAETYSAQRLPEITIFEGAATSDPVPLEPYSHSLEKAIIYFGEREYTRFRFVTKYNDVDSLIGLNHNGHTEIRFSLNTPTVIKQYEGYTASSNKRIEASIKMIEAGYPVGFLIAPIFIYPGWKEEYHKLLESLNNKLPSELKHPITFEIISHRYTIVAKNRINEIFPNNDLPMNEEERSFKYGQFGYGKYLYPKDSIDDIKQFFMKEIEELFSNKKVKYII